MPSKSRLLSLLSGSITSNGTIVVTASNFASQTANTILAAPNNIAGVPTFRALTLEDLPDAWVKKSTRAATTANITLSAPQTIDGIACIAGDRVLVKNQTTTANNGIYVVNAAAWTRALDADTIAEIAGAHVNVDSGTVNGGLSFDNDVKTTDTLGTTAITWNRSIDSGYTIPVTQGGTGVTTAAAASVFAAPTLAAGAPTFRVLTLEDLPDAWVKRSAKVATTANITLSAVQTIDGIVLVAGDRVLVKNQTIATANGIYVVAAGAWTRALDANTVSKLAGAHINVDSGTINGGLTFDSDTKNTDILDTTAITWSRVIDSAYTIPITQGGTGAISAAAAVVALGIKTGSTASTIIATGSTAERDVTPISGYLRFNTTTSQFEGYDGTIWSGIAGGTSTSTYVRNTYTATAGQTVFTSNYTVGYIIVYFNGLILPAADYTATNGSSITLSTAAVAGDIIDLVSYGVAPIGTGVTTGKAIAMAMIFGG